MTKLKWLAASIIKRNMFHYKIKKKHVRSREDASILKSLVGVIGPVSKYNPVPKLNNFPSFKVFYYSPDYTCSFR